MVGVNSAARTTRIIGALDAKTLDVRFREKAGAPTPISLLEYVRRRRGGMFVIPDGAGRPPGSRVVDEYDRNTGGGAVLGFMPPAHSPAQPDGGCCGARSSGPSPTSALAA